MTNKMTPVLLLAALAILAGGCANKKKAVNASVTDINVAPVPPKEPEYAYGAPLGGAAITATPSTPSYYAAPAVTQTPAAGGATAGGSYTVKKGDTLFSIAKATYGSGNQWQRIASANPGLSPATLKAGQTIVLP